MSASGSTHMCLVYAGMCICTHPWGGAGKHQLDTTLTMTVQVHEKLRCLVYMGIVGDLFQHVRGAWRGTFLISLVVSMVVVLYANVACSVECLRNVICMPMLSSSLEPSYTDSFFVCCGVFLLPV